MQSEVRLRVPGIALLAGSLLVSSLIAPMHQASAHRQAASMPSLVLYSAQGYDSTMAKADTATGATKVTLVDDSTGNTRNHCHLRDARPS
jgi:hypothetical protein